MAQNHYTQWLTLTPLERIRKVSAAAAFQRIEQRGIAMLLGACRMVHAGSGVRETVVGCAHPLSIAHCLYTNQAVAQRRPNC